uniref:Cytochrome P450 n=1 Tax=Glossina brevipalpis TaxID=37001 RepID=A0A1A9W2A0_9MUSC
MFWILLIFEIFFFLLWDYLRLRKIKCYFAKQGIRGPSNTLPFIGDALLFFGVTPEAIYKFGTGLFEQYGKVFHFWLGHTSVLVVADPKYYKHILFNFHVTSKPKQYELFAYITGNGLIANRSGTKSHARRKIISPTFHPRLLDQYIQIFDEISIELIQQLERYADGRTVVDAFFWTSRSTLATILETALDTKFNSDNINHATYMNNVLEIMHLFGERAVRPWLHDEFFYKLFDNKNYRKSQKLLKSVNAFYDQIIQYKRQEYELSTKILVGNGIDKNGDTTKISQEFHDDDDKSKLTDINDYDDMSTVKRQQPISFIDILLRSHINGEPLVDREIRDEVYTIIIAGNDTTANALAYTMYAVSCYPEIQEKIYKEILQVLKSPWQRSLTMNDLNAMKYLECTIKEAMRMYSTVPLIARYLLEDIKIDDKIIPAGTTIAFTSLFSNNDPDIFLRPKEFRPERFLTESNLNTFDPFAFIAFAGGPRKCLGERFAMLQMKCTMIRLLLNYELIRLGVEPKPAYSVGMHSKTGINIGLKKRINAI